MQHSKMTHTTGTGDHKPKRKKIRLTTVQGSNIATWRDKAFNGKFPKDIGVNSGHEVNGTPFPSGLLRGILIAGLLTAGFLQLIAVIDDLFPLEVNVAEVLGVNDPELVLRPVNDPPAGLAVTKTPT